MTQVPARFITFEGGEGSGKSTQSRLLYQAFQQAHIPVIHTREPGGTENAECIRELLVTGNTDRWDPVAETLLHLTARRDHIVRVLAPKLAQQYWIICDRFSDSTIAYQGYGHGLGGDYVRALSDLVVGDMKPDLTFLLDIDPELGISRTGKRQHAENRYEKMATDFHHRVREGYQAAAKLEPKRCLLLDATQPIDAIHQQIISCLKDRFGIFPN